MKNDKQISRSYAEARERYGELGVDTDKALKALSKVAISLHCWQGDDVVGFEPTGGSLSGSGLAVTGNYPGRARTIGELRKDLACAYGLIPGRHRLNLHAIYGDFGGKPVERNAIRPEHFASWIDWAASEGLKLDFNATLFAHPKASSGFTLSSRDKAVRKFWIEHVERCREITAVMGRRLKSPAVHNLWIADGSKDTPVDRMTHRGLLKDSLDEIFSIAQDRREIKDSVESKLFGIGSESFVVGSHEFYLAYAVKHDIMICLDMGHFHPTESVADKISSILQFSREMLLHVSRGVRWDSDHIVILNDELRQLAEEIVRSDALGRVHIALDYFDASINRVGAWVIGARSTIKSLLLALLEPRDRLNRYEESGDYFSRLALLEETKTLPSGAVWDYHCMKSGVTAGEDWMKEIKHYERTTLAKRGS